jgi:hypothetical protein
MVNSGLCCVEALVAEVAVDLVDAGHAAHEQALEVELGGDAHEEVDVERVHVGDEGRAAAPPARVWSIGVSTSR